MKLKIRSLFALQIVMLVTAWTCHGATVSNITATASSRYYWQITPTVIVDRREEHAVDSSGFTTHVPPQHFFGEGTAWVSVGNGYTSQNGAPGGDDPAPWIQFSFPQANTISSITVWNYGEPARAIYKADLFAGSTFVMSLQLDTELNVDNRAEAQIFQLPSPVMASSFKLVIVENGGGVTFPTTETGFSTLAGLGEVQFNTICPVGPFTTSHSTAPFIKCELALEMQQAVDNFMAAVEALGGHVTPTSGYRSPEYQKHLHEIKTKFDTLRTMGVELQMNGNRPNLKKPTDSTNCWSIIDEVNWEINNHLLGNNKGQLRVNKVSVHSSRLAVDLNISLPGFYNNSLQIYLLARKNNLWQRYGEGDAVHYEFQKAAPWFTLNFGGHSPINILVEDPVGRRVGFDSASNIAINEIGTNAWYSGPGTEPQVIQIFPPDSVTGQYKTTGVGTGNGSYTIDVSIQDEENPDIGVLRKVLSTGMASPGNSLTPIPQIDPGRNAVFLEAFAIEGGFTLFAPPWVTNAVVQSSTNLSAGAWSNVLQTLDQTNGLTLTNFTSNPIFFRLKLP